MNSPLGVLESTGFTVAPVKAAPADQVEISVIVSARGMRDAMVELCDEFAMPLRHGELTFEFLFLLERGSAVADSLLQRAARGEPVRVLYAENTVSETLLLQSAAEYARGDILILLPPRRRIVASGLLALIERVRAGADMAVACRSRRQFKWTGRLRSRLFHYMLSRVGGGSLDDLACGVRAFRRELLETLPLYGELSAYLPILALREGFRVEQVFLPQHPKDPGAGFHGPPLYIRRMIDLLNLFFVLRFAEKPLRFFGLTGAVAVGGGGVLLVMLFVQRLGGQPMAPRPLLLVAVLLLILGIQSIALGLIGEVIVHLNAPRRRPYRLAGEALLPSRMQAVAGLDRSAQP